jgi:hypothetical protein
MGDKISSIEDLYQFIQERQHSAKLRDAISYCKNLLEIKALTDKNLKVEEKNNIERCLTENYLVKHGYNYFGKRDIIYLDLYGTEDVTRLHSVE